ncbi:thiamine pyrophosphate-dependent enzyme [Bdellovibrio sp.]|uniref:thiamine pyrophosphate-dependent enzyme n=1 Tax=Bdellovibrio TaxID=958 RepID=UPI003221FAE7
MNLELKAYEGSPSTLCVGCGHDSISKHIISACFHSKVLPFQLAKMSGIGCSSKIPAYFMSSSFAFNSMHGRMAPVATGAMIAQKDLLYLGVSGDGDTGNIGLGGFLHMIRRNAPIVYLIANNGVFGLTKGQFSAAADKGSLAKSGRSAELPSLDFCTLALEAGCGFVARSFSGDGKQLVPLLQAAMKHRGTAVIDIISPCVTFNNHDGSTKSYSYMKEHDQVLQELGFFTAAEEMLADYEEGGRQKVELPDGSHLLLKKLDSRAHDVHNRTQALSLLAQTRAQEEILTGLFYVNEATPRLAEQMQLTERSLSSLQEVDLRPTPEQLASLQKDFR